MKANRSASGVIEAPSLFSIPTTFGSRHIRFRFINLEGGKELRSKQNDNVFVRAKSRISDAKRALLILAAYDSQTPSADDRANMVTDEWGAEFCLCTFSPQARGNAVCSATPFDQRSPEPLL